MKFPWTRSPTSSGPGIETPTPKPSMIKPLIDAMRRVDHEPRPAPGTAAVDDDALLCIIAIQRADRVGRRTRSESVSTARRRPTVIVIDVAGEPSTPGQCRGRGDEIRNRHIGIDARECDEDLRTCRRSRIHCPGRGSCPGRSRSCRRGVVIDRGRGPGGKRGRGRERECASEGQAACVDRLVSPM